MSGGTETIANGTRAIDEGDRFVSADGTSLCVAPYRHVYIAPAKGRWLGLPLLTAFACEFAAIQAEEIDDRGDDNKSLAAPDPSVRTSVAVSLNKFDNLVTYAKELASGSLWIKKREGECLAAGRQYVQLLEQWALDGTLASRKVEAADDISRVLASLPQLLVLSQRDVIHHATTRHEGWIPFHRPLVILHGDVAPLLSDEKSACDAPPLPPQSTHRKSKSDTTAVVYQSRARLLFVEKPFGMPVHPSGKYRKNSVTMILEDIFGGQDANKYECVCSDDGAFVDVVHKQGRFVIVRISRRVNHESLVALTQLVGAKCSVGLKVYVVHRLDVGTSGVLMFGLSSDCARRTTGLLAQKTLAVNVASCSEDLQGVEWWKVLEGAEKHYVARVKGHFEPQGSLCRWLRPLHDGKHDSWYVLAMPIYCASYFNSFYGCPAADDLAAAYDEIRKLEGVFAKANNNGGGMLLAQEAPRSLQEKKEAMRKVAVSKRPIERQARVDSKRTREGDQGEEKPDTSNFSMAEKYPQLKSAVSAFRFLKYDAASDESVVECIPITGRTHQLRVHLNYLGHPIANDFKYLHGTVDSPQGDTASVAAPEGGGHYDVPQATEELFLFAFRYALTFNDVAPGFEGKNASIAVEAPWPSWAN